MKNRLKALLILSILLGVFIFSLVKEQRDVESLVKTFGKRLQSVSLLAPEEALREAMEENYGDLVSSPQLITEWASSAQENPKTVPGRLTSSPWPDRIEILNIEKLSRQRYEVRGEVVEMTSTGESGRRPIMIIVKKRRIAKIIFQDFNNDQIEKAVTDYLLTQSFFSWKNREESISLCTIENLDYERELFPLYLWVYCGEYVLEDGELKTESGSSGPAKVDYPNELSFYQLDRFSYEAPRDGSYYADDIKRIFPENLQQRVFSFDARSIIQKSEANALAALQAWESIKQSVKNCEVKEIWQTHAKEVTAELKDGTRLTALEPRIDEIMDIVELARPDCGEVLIATE